MPLNARPAERADRGSPEPLGAVGRYRASLRRLEDVPAAHWQRLSHRASYYLTYDWMAVMASTLGAELHAILLRDGGGAPLLGFPVSLITRDSSPAFDPLRLLVEAGRDAATQADPAGEGARLAGLADRLDAFSRRLYPVLTSVAPGFAGGVCEAPSLQGEGALTARDTALHELELQARSLCAGAVGFLYVIEGSDRALARRAASHGYGSVAVAGRCRLEVAWATFDDYLQARTRTRRKSIRAEVARFRERFELQVVGAEGLTEELVPLHAQWRAKYGHPVPEPELRSQYAAIRERLGPSVRLFVARRQGRPVAFAQFYEHEGVYYSRAIGFDYAHTGDNFCYFNVLFYEPLREAMRRGIRAIDYSFGSYEAKLGRGCQVQPFLLYLKPLVPAEAWLDEYMLLVDRAVRARLDRLRALHP